MCQPSGPGFIPGMSRSEPAVETCLTCLSGFFTRFELKMGGPDHAATFLCITCL